MTDLEQLKQEIAKAREETRNLAKEKDEQIQHLNTQLQRLQKETSDLKKEKDKQIKQLNDELQLTKTNLQKKVKTEMLKAGGVLVSNDDQAANPGKNDLIVKGKVGIGNSTPDHPLVVGPSAGGRHLVVNDIPKARWGFSTGNFNLAVQNDNSGTWETFILLTKNDVVVNGNIQFLDKIETKGRMHISGGERLFLLNKEGVIIGKEWGGNGNLSVQGNLNIDGEIRGKLWYSKEYEWTQGQAAVRMEKSDKTVAFLTYVRGGFEGHGEKVKVYKSGGYWYLGGEAGSLGVSLKAKARCIGMP